MTFTWPLALLGLVLVPVLAALYVWSQRRRVRCAVRFTNLALLREVAGRGPGLRRHVPQASVMLVLDVSGSMAARDIQPARLGAAQQAAKQLIGALPPGAQVGVVAFSDRAFVADPLAPDATAAGYRPVVERPSEVEPGARSTRPPSSECTGCARAGGRGPVVRW